MFEFIMRIHLYQKRGVSTCLLRIFVTFAFLYDSCSNLSVGRVLIAVLGILVTGLAISTIVLAVLYGNQPTTGISSLSDHKLIFILHK